MKGALIYTAREAKRNSFAVKKYISNLNMTLLLAEQIDFSKKSEFDFVINRTNDFKIARHFEKNSARVFNPSSLTKLANNKSRCYKFMKERGIPIMPVGQKNPPLVEKPDFGHGGQGVRLIETADFEKRDGFVYQKLCDTPGVDVRVYMLGGKIVCACRRKSKTDFRSNYSLGGKASLYTLGEAERELINKVDSLIQYDFIGIDLIFNKGKPVFNEIEDTVGARMVYNLTNLDIIKLYCDYIKSEMAKAK